MVKPVVKDIIFLSQKSTPAGSGPEDMETARDLLDTLAANAEHCVGMAANMIGVSKNIIAVNVGMTNIIMMNPIITKKSGPYMTEEGCLSLEGVRPTQRYQNIEVVYRDMSGKKKMQKFSGWTAQIIQHEVDHLYGKII